MKAEEFGEYLKSLRKRKKLTIRQLDTYSGVSNSYISQMERGERGVPSPDILRKLSKPLGIEYDELMKKAGHSDSKLSDGAKMLMKTIDLSVSEIEAVEKIKESFAYKGEPLTDDQAKIIYFLSLGVVKKE